MASKKKVVVYKTPVPYSPIDNTPVVQAKEYQKSFLDFLRERGLIQSAFISFQGSATNVLYTCPVGEVFYLTHVSMALANDAAISLPTVDFGINDATIIATITSGKPDGTSANITQEFSNPIRLTAGQTLTIRNNRANCWIRIGFIGYQISEALSRL